MTGHFANFASLKKLCAGLALTALCALAGAGASAAPINLVKNGDFELAGGNGQLGYNTSVADWSSSGGYNFLFAQGTADTSGAVSWFGAPLTLWGANNGGAHALAVSGDGGNFIGADGNYGVAPIRQLIDGLTVGQTYEVSFEWAAAQQFGFSGATTEYWRVNLGNDDAATWQATSIYQNANHGSSGWMNASMLFTASSVSEWLTFMAVGTPEGEPPFSLLDGVSMTAVERTGEVPEPASLAMFIAGLGLIALFMRRRNRSS